VYLRHPVCVCVCGSPTTDKNCVVQLYKERSIYRISEREIHCRLRRKEVADWRGGRGLCGAMFFAALHNCDYSQDGRREGCGGTVRMADEEAEPACSKAEPLSAPCTRDSSVG
jgi:hypothetical protein